PWGRWSEWLTANPDRVPGTQSRWSQGKDLSFTAPTRLHETGLRPFASLASLRSKACRCADSAAHDGLRPLVEPD
ncbi:ATP-dependent DNA ligase, partial [Nocardioides sp. NPDC006273]